MSNVSKYDMKLAPQCDLKNLEARYVAFDNKNKQFFIYREFIWIQLSQDDFNTFIENSKPFTFLTYPVILIGTLLFGFLYSVILSLFIKTKKQL